MNSTHFYVLTKNVLVIQMIANHLLVVFSIIRISLKKTSYVLVLKTTLNPIQKNASLTLKTDAMMEYADLIVSI